MKEGMQLTVAEVWQIAETAANSRKLEHIERVISDFWSRAVSLHDVEGLNDNNRDVYNAIMRAIERLKQSKPKVVRSSSESSRYSYDGSPQSYKSRPSSQVQSVNRSAQSKVKPQLDSSTTKPKHVPENIAKDVTPNSPKKTATEDVAAKSAPSAPRASHRVSEALKIVNSWLGGDASSGKPIPSASLSGFTNFRLASATNYGLSLSDYSQVKLVQSSAGYLIAVEATNGVFEVYPLYGSIKYNDMVASGLNLIFGISSNATTIKITKVTKPALLRKTDDVYIVSEQGKVEIH